MSHPPHDPDRDDERVRSLLAGLPDPGPMPADLVARIGARLEQERRPSGGATVLAFPTGERVPPSRRLVLGLTGAVAAAATLGVVGVDLLRQGDTPPVVAALAAPLARHTSPAPSPDPAQNPSPHIYLSGTAYTSAGLPAQAAALRATASPTVAPLSGGAVGVGPLASPAGVATCLDAVGVHQPTAVSVDLATFDGRPAAVLVTTSDDRTQARVVPRTCGGADSTVLHGPVDVP